MRNLRFVSCFFFVLLFGVFLGFYTVNGQTKFRKHMYSYLALGDSYTIGELVPHNENFPNQTVALLHKSGIDMADPVIIATTGWTTDELAASMREHHLSETFSIVTLLIGVNNQYRGRSVGNYAAEFEQLLVQAIHFAGGSSNRVFVLSTPDWGATPFAEGKDHAKIALEIDAYNQVEKEIVEKYHCHYLEITESTRANGKIPLYLASDGLHPSGKEYAIWSEILAQQVKKVLK